MGAKDPWPLTGEHAEDAVANEQPQRTVALKAYCIDLLEVTQADYDRCTAAHACVAPASKDASCHHDVRFAEHPESCTTQPQAAAFCAWRGARLPTEDEWEYAARGADGRVYPWGKAPKPSERSKPARFCEQQFLPQQATCPVGSAPAGRSPFGVYDMTGNGQEWTSSPFCSYSHPSCTNPDGAFAVRSSAGADDASRVTSRKRVLPTESDSTSAFRCAVTGDAAARGRNGHAQEDAVAGSTNDSSLSEAGVYHNARFGFSVRYPSTLQPQEEAENGDGRHFVSKDGSVDMAAWGQNLMAGEFATRYALEVEPKSTRTVTYKAKGDRWFVVSGREAGKISYRRALTNAKGDVIAVFEIAYPEAARATYDKIVADLASSLSLPASD